jgi:hypothetical protein
LRNRTYSIKNFILKYVLITILVVMSANALYIYLDARREINEIFDARLA